MSLSRICRMLQFGGVLVAGWALVNWGFEPGHSKYLGLVPPGLIALMIGTLGLAVIRFHSKRKTDGHAPPQE